jgi:hypothetical protein
MTLPTRDLPPEARDLIRAMAESARRWHNYSRNDEKDGDTIARYSRGCRDGYLRSARMVRYSFGGRA